MSALREKQRECCGRSVRRFLGWEVKVVDTPTLTESLLPLRSSAHHNLITRLPDCHSCKLCPPQSLDLYRWSQKTFKQPQYILQPRPHTTQTYKPQEPSTNYPPGLGPSGHPLDSLGFLLLETLGSGNQPPRLLSCTGPLFSCPHVWVTDYLGYL